MADVSYDHELDYVRDSEIGKPFPGLWVVVYSPADDRQLEVQAHLDSGTERSLFDGQTGKAIGLDPGDSEVLYYRSTTGAELVARLHRVWLAHAIWARTSSPLDSASGESHAIYSGGISSTYSRSASGSTNPKSSFHLSLAASSNGFFSLSKA